MYQCLDHSIQLINIRLDKMIIDCSLDNPVVVNKDVAPIDYAA